MQMLLGLGFELDTVSYEVSLTPDDVSSAVNEALSSVKYIIESREPEIFQSGKLCRLARVSKYTWLHIALQDYTTDAREKVCFHFYFQWRLKLSHNYVINI